MTNNGSRPRSGDRTAFFLRVNWSRSVKREKFSLPAIRGRRIILREGLVNAGRPMMEDGWRKRILLHAYERPPKVEDHDEQNRNQNLDLFYGSFHALLDINLEVEEDDHGTDRAVRLWKIDASQGLEPNERPD